VVYASRPPDATAAYRAADGQALWIHEVADIGGDSGRTYSIGVLRGTTRTKETRPLRPEEWTDLRMQACHVPGWGLTIVVTGDGNVAAIDGKGQRTWVSDVARRRWSLPPAVAADLGLVFAGGWGDGSELVALDANSGARRWSVAVRGLNGIASAGGRVFAPAIPEVDGRIDGRLHAFDAGTGERIWTFRPGAAAPKAREDGVVEIQAGGVTVRRGQIHHPGDETRMWQARAAAGGSIVITEVPARRFALDASDGKVLWAEPVGGIRLGAAERDGLVWGTSEAGEIVAIDPRDGTVARRIDLTKLEAAEDAPKLVVRRGIGPPADELGDLSEPAFDGDVCYVTSASGWTIALRIPPFRSRAER
jgi:outer membrane protein assembly factor BamB